MSAADIQALLRFLTKDAKVPLATAMSKVKDMQQAQLSTFVLFPLQRARISMYRSRLLSAADAMYPATSLILVVS